MDKVGWGIIGAGGIADRRTIPGMQLANNAELIAVMQPDLHKASMLCKKHGAKRAYDDEAALLCDDEIDAVYIASPVAFHAKQAIMAADAGKHVLIEKPIALTVQEAETIARHCREKGVKAAAGFMMRFGSYALAMKEAVLSGKIGNLVSAYAQFTCYYPDIPGSWRQDKSKSGGGALMDMGIHCIDLVQFISGSRVTSVAAFHDTLSFNYEVEDSSCVMMRLANGALCAVQSNFNIPDEAAKWQLEFFGDRGRLIGDAILGQIDGGRLDAIFMSDVKGYDAQQDIKQNERAKIDVAFGNMYQREIESFGRSILQNTPPEVPLEEGIAAQRVVEAAYRSNNERRVIDLPFF